MATTDATAAAAPAAEVLHPCGLTLDERFKLMRSVGEECIADAELMNLLAKKPEIRCYDGFEPSGRMHIAQGIFKAINVNKCTRVGCKFTFWVADWFALMNDKMGGELDKIRVVGQYLTEVWTAAGMDMTNVDFRWSSDDINKHAKDYWIRVIDIGRNNTIARMKKCCQIMGRTDGSLSTAQLLYPLMQCADIFHLKADVCQLGKDQRKVNMLAREYCDAIGRKLKPVILSHHMLTGLVKGQGKMSKSNPMSAIFMEDTAEDVALKINAAHCPRVAQGEAKYTDDGELIGSDDVNPCLDYVNCTAFAMPGGTFTAGGRTFTSYAELETAFVKEELSEADLKAGLIDVVNGLLEPVREHFRTNERARAVLEQVKSFRNASAPAAAPAADAAAQQPKATTPRLVAWLPAALKIPLFDLVALTESLNRFAAQSEGHEAVLVLPDWTGYAQTAVGGDEKDINAALDLHAKIMVALGLSPKVQIKRQSDVILADPNAYWLNVIAAGRRFPLSAVEAALGPDGAKDAGFVVAALMRVADVVAFNATEGLSFDADGLHTLAAEFTNGNFKGVSAAAECRPTLCDPKSAPTIADDWLYADEGDMDIRRKLKRAFAAPQDNTSTVAQMACFFAVRKGLAVVRPEANGGNKNYDSAAAVLDDCASGALHPGDLKAAVSNDLMALTQPIRDFLGSAEGKKLVTALKAAEKKVAKGKK